VQIRAEIFEACLTLVLSQKWDNKVETGVSSEKNEISNGRSLFDVSKIEAMQILL